MENFVKAECITYIYENSPYYKQYYSLNNELIGILKDIKNNCGIHRKVSITVNVNGLITSITFDNLFDHNYKDKISLIFDYLKI